MKRILLCLIISNFYWYACTQNSDTADQGLDKEYKIPVQTDPCETMDSCLSHDSKDEPEHNSDDGDDYFCGDLKCSHFETVETCPGDCSICGDGICTYPENTDNCSADCTTCGDGICMGNENPQNCLTDCPCGSGTSLVDGIFSSGEWENACAFVFDANLAVIEGGTTPAILYVMNDNTNIYFGLKIKRISLGGANNPIISFDPNNNGIWREIGDDLIGLNAGNYTPAWFFDGYYYSCDGLTSVAGCGAMDSETTRGILPAGTIDGSAGATNDGQYTYLEMSHPLNSNDDLHDISVYPGDTIGFILSLRLGVLDPYVCNTCFGDTYLVETFHINP